MASGMDKNGGKGGEKVVEGGGGYEVEEEEEEEAHSIEGGDGKMERLKAAVEELARFRPPFTPSNSLLQSPPAIKVTRPPPPSIHHKETREEQAEEEADQQEPVDQLQQQSESVMPRQHQPQPFPLPLRRRSSTTSNPHSPGSSPANRHSMPRLSITSLGSAAKSFRTLAAFIVPEQQAERERERELRRTSSQRRASLAAMRERRTATTDEQNCGKKRVEWKSVDVKVKEAIMAISTTAGGEGGGEGGEGGKQQQMNNATLIPSHQSPFGTTTKLMRSSSARPVPRSMTTTPAGGLPPPPHSSRPTPLPRQNGGANQRGGRTGGDDGSRSRSAAAHHLQNGRAPSVSSATPRMVNKKYAHVKSKVNSITDHSPAPSAIRIFHQPIRVNATPKVGSLQNAGHVPAGGNVRIENRKLNFREAAKARVDAVSDVPMPKSEKKILTQKLVWSAESKVGSLENAAHTPGGGQKKIFNEPVKVKADSKVGSLDNVGHVPGGGNVKISDYSRSISGTGSVRSRRDTADSGRSSSLASGGGGHQTHPSPNKSATVENSSTPVRGEPIEILITPRDMGGEERRHHLESNGLAEHHHQTRGGEVAESQQLIDFGEENGQ